MNNKTAVAGKGLPWGRMLAAMLLVGGTCIGGGMLALPVATATAGFWPSCIAMAVCCLFMAMTGLLFLEVALWMEPGVHIVTMSRRMLGPFGKWIAILLYLFIGYASLVAYISGVGELLSDALAYRTGWNVPFSLCCGLFALTFGSVFYFGNRLVGRVNTLLFFGMIAAYVLLILAGTREINPELLHRGEATATFYSLPLLLTIFSYQAIVPSLPLYVGRHPVALRWSVLGGALLALGIYIVWQLLIFGVVPYEGSNGLAEAYQHGQVVTSSFRDYAQNTMIPLMGNFFSFFALITSFLGIGLGLFDFLADGLKWERTGARRGLLTLVIVLPSLLVATVWSRAFIEALDSTGGFGDAILNGMIPVAMVWVGRYWRGMPAVNRLIGGRPMLLILFLFACFVFGVELLERLHILTPIDDLR